MMTKPVIFLIIFSFALTSCMTQKKQQRIAHAYFSQHPLEKAEICAEFIDIDKVIQGNPIVVVKETELPEKTKGIADYIDSISAKIELVGPSKNLLDSLKQVVLRDCKPKEINTIIIDTIPWENKAKIISRDSTIFRMHEEMALIKAKLELSEKDVKHYKKRSRERLGALIVILSVIAVGIYLKIKGIGVSSIFNIFKKIRK